MADRFEADAELVRQQFDVVAAGFGCTQEAHVRHHQRTGEIVGETDPRLRDACLIGEPGARHHRIDLRQVAVQGQLGRHLERLLSGLQVIGQPQPPRTGIVVPLFAPGLQCGHFHQHAMAVGQQLAQPRCHMPGRQPPFGEQLLGQLVQLGNVVVHAVEELAHLVTGGQGAAGAGLAQLELQCGRVLAQRQVTTVQVQQRAADLRQVAGQGAQFGRADLGQAQVAQGFAQRLLQGGGLIVIEQRGNVAQHLSQLLLHRRCQWALVALDLVQVAGRQPQRTRQIGLAVAALLAQPQQAQAELPLGS